jgi:copper chaperone
MKTVQFKTTIKCGGCIAKVTPVLNNNFGIESWNVDLENPDRILTLSGEAIDEQSVVDALAKTGYKAEKRSN